MRHRVSSNVELERRLHKGRRPDKLEEFPVIAPVAQLDRASGYEPEGRVFESPRAHQKIEKQHLRRFVAGLRRPLDLLFSARTIEVRECEEEPAEPRFRARVDQPWQSST